MFSNEEIHDISNRIKCPQYGKLPLEKNNKNWCWEGKDFPRVMSLLEFQKFFYTNGNSFNRGLCFSGGGDPELEYVNIDYKKDLVYDGTTMVHDLNNPSFQFGEKDFDIAFLHQTLEHLYNPLIALKNIYNHMRIGGIFYCNVPVLNIPHMKPFNFYTGFTSVGLACLIKQAGFEIVELGQWGNLEYITKLYSTHTWPDYRQLADPTKNELDNPVISWCFARK